MSLFTMASELTGMLPKMPWNYSVSVVNRAVLDAYRQSIWSFQTFESNWTTPAGWVQSGSVSTQQGNNIVIFDPVNATPALNAIGMYPSPITKRQFRTGGVGTIYNIWQYLVPAGTVNTLGTAVTWVTGTTFDVFGNQNILVGQPIVINGVTYTVASIVSPVSLTTTPSPAPGTQNGVAFSTGAIATLDRPYQEATVASQGYAVLQCYYVSPVPDFKGWYSVRDMLNYNELFTNKTREWGNIQDPQRTFYYLPTHVWFYQNDMNPASSTFGWPMFEMWGAPTYQLTYQIAGYRKGMPLVNPADELPSGIGEDCVMAKARYYGYEWAEANRVKGERIGNFLQLKKDSLAEYNKLYRSYRKDDRFLADAFHTRYRRSRAFPNLEPSYNAISGVASSGI